jgi:hypothetical protein
LPHLILKDYYLFVVRLVPYCFCNRCRFVVNRHRFEAQTGIILQIPQLSVGTGKFMNLALTSRGMAKFIWLPTPQNRLSRYFQNQFWSQQSRRRKSAIPLTSASRRWERSLHHRSRRAVQLSLTKQTKKGYSSFSATSTLMVLVWSPGNSVSNPLNLRQSCDCFCLSGDLVSG